MIRRRQQPRTGGYVARRPIVPAAGIVRLSGVQGNKHRPPAEWNLCFPSGRNQTDDSPVEPHFEIACAPGKLVRSSRWKTGAGKP
jgi:hypothetical protein